MARHGRRGAFWSRLPESVRVGAKRHMPNPHTVRPDLQSDSLAAYWRPSVCSDECPCNAELMIFQDTGQTSIEWRVAHRAIPTV